MVYCGIFVVISLHGILWYIRSYFIARYKHHRRHAKVWKIVKSSPFPMWQPVIDGAGTFECLIRSEIRTCIRYLGGCILSQATKEV